MTSRAAGWPLDAPTAAQLKEFFAQIESGRITKERLQSFLRTKSEVSELVQIMDILELELGVRAYNVLKRVGIETIGDLLEKSEDDLSQLPNMDKRSREEIKERLAERGLALKGVDPQVKPIQNAEPEVDLESAVIKLFELTGLMDARIRLIDKHAEARFALTRALTDAGRARASLDLDRLNGSLADLDGLINAKRRQLRADLRLRHDNPDAN